MTCAVVDFPPTVAVIVVEPFATAVTVPFVTVANSGCDDVQVAGDPVMGVPLASPTVSVKLKVSPIDTRVFDAGAKLTVSTACVTVRVAVALTLPTFAVIVDVPT